MIQNIDDEVSFRSGDRRRVFLGEITNTNTTPTKQESSAKPASLAWKEGCGFPPALDDVPEERKAVRESESPLFRKTPQGKSLSREAKASVSGNCDEDSEDDNDDTVAIEILNLSNASDLNNVDVNDSCMSREVMLKLPSFNIPKYTEADMQNARKEWQQDARNLEEAVSIADKLLSRAMLAESARNELQAEVKKAKTQAQGAQEELLKEKEEKSISNTQTRALSHALQAMELDMRALKETHGSDLRGKDEECQKQLQELKKAFEAEKGQFMKEKLSALYSATERSAQLQAQLKQQQEAADAAVVDAKQKVYAKVKAQFDNGNKEFNRIKAEKEAVSKELESCQVLLRAEQDKCTAGDATNSALRDKVHLLGEALCSVLKEALPSAQYSRAAKLLSSAEMAVSGPQDLEAVNTLCEHAKNCIGLRSKELSDIQEATKAVNTEVSAVKKALEEKDTALLGAFSKCAQLEEEHQRAQVSAKALQQELHDVHKEKDSQMLAVAKLATSNTTLEIQVETMQGEMSELTARNAGLRKMNEEMMAMLEKAHGV